MNGALDALLNRADYLDAYRLVGGREGLVAPVDPERGDLHARLAYHLGDASLGTALARRLYYTHSEHPSSRAAYGREILRRRGGLRTIEWLRERGVTVSTAHHREDLVLCACAYLGLRDTSAAEALLQRARESGPTDPYIEALMASALLTSDRAADARDAYGRLQAEHPRYPAIVLGYVEALYRTGERALGLDVLRHFAAETQAGRAQLSLAQRADELGDHSLAKQAAERAAERLPLIGKSERRGLLAMRFRTSYALGERDEAVQHLRTWNTAHSRALAERVAQASHVPGDVRLATPYVRQGHLTCAPASLTSICRFFGDMVEHDEVAGEICFGGTPSVRQRRWAAERGMIVRGFELSIDAGRALIDRGLPFTLVTHASSSSHLQVVRGYDPVREAWLIMDPSADCEVLLEWSGIAETQAFMGPDCALYVPRDQAALLDDLELPAAGQHETFATFEDALDLGDLDTARAAVETLRQQQVDGVLTCRAEVALARALTDRTGELDATRRWLRLFPETASLKASLAELERAVGVPLNTRLAHVAPWAESWDARLLAEAARTLMASPARWPDAARLLRRANLADPRGGYPLGCMAELATLAQQWEVAMETSRFALCLDESYDFAARTYFLAASRLRRREEALGFLEAHARRVGRRSGVPLIWLADSLSQAGKPRLALETLLARSLEARREDSSLHLELARLALSLGEVDTARAALERASKVATVVQVAPLRAQLAAHEGDLGAALAALEAALAEAPWAPSVIEGYANMLARAQGWAAAKEWLRERALARPDLLSLVVCACRWLQDDPLQEAEVIEAALRRWPRDAWLTRELALTRSALGRLREAEALLDEVLSLDALDAIAHRLRGTVLAEQHRTREALAAYQAALAVEPTDRQCIDGIARLDLSLDEKRSALNAFVDTLEQGTPHDDDLAGVMPIARLLPADDAVALGERLVAAFPDVVTAHTSAVELALVVAREATAAELLERARAQFPDDKALQQLELDLARHAHDDERAVALSYSLTQRYPLDRAVLLDYVTDLRRTGEVARAVDVIQTWLARAGESAAVRRTLASIRYGTDGAGAALDVLMPLLTEGHLDEALWFDATRYAELAQRLPELLGLLDRLESERPYDPALPWYRAQATRDEARRAALERARQLAPESVKVVEALAHYWADCGDFERALAYCPPPDWRGEMPVVLQGRRADIVRRRGNLDAAIDDMLGILERDPNYAWGIDRLLEWTQQAHRPADRLHAARLLRRTAPSNPRSFACLADALLAQKLRAEARDVLQEALVRHPKDAYAVSTLLRILVEDGHIERAEAVVRGLPVSLAAGVRLEAKVRVAMARGKLHEATRAVLAVADATPAPTLHVDDAAAIVEALVFRLEDPGPLRTFARDALRRGCPPQQEEFWCEFGAALVRHDPSFARVLTSNARGLSRVGLRSLGCALQRLSSSTAESFRAELVAGRGRFPYEPELWGGVAYILSGLERHNEVYQWTEGFDTKPGVKPWMVWHRVNAALASDRLYAARDAARFALTLPPDRNRRFFALSFALLSWLAGAPVSLDDLGDNQGDEPLLRDVLRLLRASRDEWSTDAATFAHMTEGAWDTLLLDHAGRLPQFETVVLELAMRALTAYHARLAGRFARATYARRLRKRLRRSWRSSGSE